MKHQFPSIFRLSTTGQKVVVSRKKDFVRGYHLPVTEVPKEETVSHEEVMAEFAEEEEESAQAVDGGQARFDEMKAARYWTKGVEAAAEYQRMKAIHG